MIFVFHLVYTVKTKTFIWYTSLISSSFYFKWCYTTTEFSKRTSMGPRYYIIIHSPIQWMKLNAAKYFFELIFKKKKNLRSIFFSRTTFFLLQVSASLRRAWRVWFVRIGIVRKVRPKYPVQQNLTRSIRSLLGGDRIRSKIATTLANHSIKWFNAWFLGDSDRILST